MFLLSNNSVCITRAGGKAEFSMHAIKQILTYCRDKLNIEFHSIFAFSDRGPGGKNYTFQFQTYD